MKPTPGGQPRPTIIEPTPADDLLYARCLMREHTEQVGFLPDAALRWYADHGCVWSASINEDPVGYLVAKPLKSADNVHAILQACIQMDARRMHSGLALVEHVCMLAAEDGRDIVQCWCRDDLEANHFWKAAGFVEVCRKNGGERRGREVILYRRALAPMTPDHLMAGIIIRGPGGAFVPQINEPTLFGPPPTRPTQGQQLAAIAGTTLDRLRARPKR
jgi:hypothetical protein